MSEPDIPPMLDRRPLVASYTLLHTWEDVCPYQAAQRFIYRSVPFVETDAMRWGNEVHSAMEHRVGGGKPLPTNMQQWERFASPFDGRGAVTEGQLGCTDRGQPSEFFGKQVFARGKIDVAIRQETRAFINDWKTGKSRYETPFELEFHALLLKAKYPQLEKIVGTYTYLGEDKISQPYDLSDFRGTWQHITGTMRNITDARQAGEYEKRRGPLCGYCPVKDCEHNSAA